MLVFKNKGKVNSLLIYHGNIRGCLKNSVSIPWFFKGKICFDETMKIKELLFFHC
ncbi:hypothetical protein HanIR_Chr11g0558871 [Helianthus annuus]|nr:hypothetical protein HanIR_Chr11g0558871 [Helianthus annuus]